MSGEYVTKDEEMLRPCPFKHDSMNVKKPKLYKPSVGSWAVACGKGTMSADQNNHFIFIEHPDKAEVIRLWNTRD